MKWLTLLMCAAASAAAQPVLYVEDVVESARRRYPAILAAMLDREIAEADVLSAEGAFDPTIRARFDSDSLGYYSNRRFDASFRQPLSWQGMALSGGYRVGDGDFAPYDGKLATRSLGEVRSGLEMPLLRDRGIDTRRGELAKSRIGRKIADLSVDQQRLTVLQAAISRYWQWVAAGRRLAVTREVLAIADKRQSLLEEAVRAGQLAAIEAIDNRRAILQRRTALVEAERAFEQSSIDLSLFLRDATGAPVLPTADQVPDRFPTAGPIDGNLTADVTAALGARPELARLEAQADQNDIDWKLARNRTLPAIDFSAGFASDSGTGISVRRGPQEFKAALSFELPLRNRTAQGKQAAAAAKARQIDTRLGLLRDQIAAEVQDARSAVRAAHSRVEVLGEEVRVSRDLEEAERTRFEIGDGTLFMLNLREQATLDAAIREAFAQADYQRARATLDYATGRLLQ